MVSQATTNGQSIEAATAGVGENVANLAQDLVSLTELQAQLVMLDVTECVSQARRPIAALCAGGCIFIGAVPVMLLSFGSLLAEATDFSPAFASLLIAAAACAAAGLCTWYAFGALQQAICLLSRSRREFQENLRWIKKAIHQKSPARSC